jgi:hypothetical protein
MRGLFETHLDVIDLDRSLGFYGAVLGLGVALRRKEVDATRADALASVPAASRFSGSAVPGEAMLGLGERPRERVFPQHFRELLAQPKTRLQRRFPSGESRDEAGT